MKQPSFATEADLCAAFLSALPKEWTAYPETQGWDILLVRSSDGFQIGIEAKLKLNARVLLQAAEDGPHFYGDRPGPDCRAVLVPASGVSELAGLAPHLCLTVIRVTLASHYWQRVQFWPGLPHEQGRFTSADDWHELLPAKRHRLPDYVPDVHAGASAPIQLTDWKIRAMRIAVLLGETGFVDRSDFKRIGIDIRRWIEGRWLVPADRGFIGGPKMPDFQKQHPRNWEDIRADVKSWRRPDVLMRVT